MCGIVGYVGARDAADVLMDGLSRLEYRGYDSAGIAVFENGEVKVAKSKGRLKNLEEKMNAEGRPRGNVGIGHTRWATHGEPSDRNSHPHAGGSVTIVHNGIIENYKKLKDFLLSKGKQFLSDTDTEVVAQLLGYYYELTPGNPVDAIIRTMKDLEGSYALGVVFADFPDMVFALRKESPLIVGIGDEECFIASDVTAILQYTRKYYLLDPGEIAVLSRKGAKVYDMHYQKIEKELKIADWDVSAAEKGGYPHFMIKEIHEQPTAIKTTIAPRIANGMPDLSECGITPEKLNEFKAIHIVACGTAMHAGVVGKYVIEKLAKVPVNVDIASEFRYRDPLVGEGDLVIIISQSGETADSLEALRLAKKLGAQTLAVVNAKGSSIAREADMLIYTHAGPEIAVASTKAYMVQIAVMYLFAFEFALAKGKIDETECRRLTALLEQTPEKIEAILANHEMTQKIADSIITADSLLYIGRGLDYALSMEGSLKLKEISYIHSESYAAGELKHGTISLITENMPVIAVATQTKLFDKTISNIKEVKSRGAKVILVSREDYVPEKDVADYQFALPQFDDLLMPMLAVVPLQLIAYYTAVHKGTDVDKPRNLAKSVTVE
ncbi:MAG: glutamine--fructose-6-phosphate transaminase (isomerizing) [Oscillospiraceae bacterium]|nr:glutamine--fructose-6-phosphate transaminase (isomerizing) [Oscillospiraceae bacterium]